MGGYDSVIEHKMWKYLFGLDCGFNTISRKKYERVLLPFEKYEMSMGFTAANNGALKTDNGMDGTSSRDGGITRRLTEAEIAEIQRQMKLREADGQSSSMPVAVIVGNQKSHLQMQQPHTTITVHQTTIHPQTKVTQSACQHQSQSPCQSNTISSKFNSIVKYSQDGHRRKSGIEDYMDRDYLASHLAQLGPSTSLRHVRMRNDRGRDSPLHPSIGSITLSAIRKSANNSISHAGSSKSTTITPIMSKHSKQYASAISEIIDLVDSDNEGSRGSGSPHSRAYHGGSVPNMKKRKLDILRQGGLEVTAISNRNGPAGRHQHGTSAAQLLAAASNVSKINGSKLGIASLPDINVSLPLPRFQSTSMYTRTSTIFGNPNEMLRQGQQTEYNCIDLSVEKCNPALRIRLPESTTIQKAHTFSPFATGQKLTDPNLQITLVPPLQSAHNFSSSKRKANDNGKSTSSSSSSSALSAMASIGGPSGSSGDRATVTPIPHGLMPAALLSAAAAASNSSTDIDSRLLPPPAILNVPNMNDLKINQLFLQNMLDPMYLTNFYNNPNLLFQQSLPPEVLQGLGIIPISKS